MRQSARIYIHATGGGFDVLCRIPHAMNAENYLIQATFRRNGALQAEVLLGRYVAADPVIGTHFDSLEKADEITVRWRDLAGTTDEASRIFDGETD